MSSRMRRATLRITRLSSTTRQVLIGGNELGAPWGLGRYSEAPFVKEACGAVRLLDRHGRSESHDFVGGCSGDLAPAAAGDRLDVEGLHPAAGEAVTQRLAGKAAGDLGVQPRPWTLGAHADLVGAALGAHLDPRDAPDRQGPA